MENFLKLQCVILTSTSQSWCTKEIIWCMVIKTHTSCNHKKQELKRPLILLQISDILCDLFFTFNPQFNEKKCL